jgi:hypothetical protein
MAHLYLWNDGNDSGEPGVGYGSIKDGSGNMSMGVSVLCNRYAADSLEE